MSLFFEAAILGCFTLNHPRFSVCCTDNIHNFINAKDFRRNIFFRFVLPGQSDIEIDYYFERLYLCNDECNTFFSDFGPTDSVFWQHGAYFFGFLCSQVKELALVAKKVVFPA